MALHVDVVGFALTKKEDKESYKFVLDWISRTSKKKPECVMADGDTATTAAIGRHYVSTLQSIHKSGLLATGLWQCTVG